MKIGVIKFTEKINEKTEDEKIFYSSGTIIQCAAIFLRLRPCHININAKVGGSSHPVIAGLNAEAGFTIWLSQLKPKASYIKLHLGVGRRCSPVDSDNEILLVVFVVHVGILWHICIRK